MRAGHQDRSWAVWRLCRGWLPCGTFCGSNAGGCRQAQTLDCNAGKPCSLLDSFPCPEILPFAPVRCVVGCLPLEDSFAVRCVVGCAFVPVRSAVGRVALANSFAVRCVVGCLALENSFAVRCAVGRAVLEHSFPVRCVVGCVAFGNSAPVRCVVCRLAPGNALPVGCAVSCFRAPSTAVAVPSGDGFKRLPAVRANFDDHAGSIMGAAQRACQSFLGLSGASVGHP